MGMSKAEFARRCGVSRAAVTKAAAKDKQLIVIEADGTIDPAHPINRAYLEMHARPGTMAAPNAGDSSATGQKKRPRKAKKPTGKPVQPTIPTGQDSDDEDAADEDDGESGEDFGVVASALDKAYYSAKKLKLDCDLKELDKAERMGQLIDRRIVAAKFGALSQAIQSNFVDAPTKYAMITCGILGTPGREHEIEEALAEYNQKGIEEIIRICTEAEALQSGGGK